MLQCSLDCLKEVRVEGGLFTDCATEEIFPVYMQPLNESATLESFDLHGCMWLHSIPFMSVGILLVV